MAEQLGQQLVSLSGTRPGDVLDTVAQRARTGSRADNHRVALVVEGGSMRGVYTAGSLLGLHAMGLWNLFDNVYGTSAGAINAGHFLSGQGDIKVDTYYRYLADMRFINPYRFWRIADIDFFIDEVLTKSRRLESELLMSSATPLWVSVIDFVSARPLLLHAQSGKYPIQQILKAAVAIPILYNKVIPLGDLRCFDAGFCNPFPLDSALAHGNTHVVVLLSKPQGHISRPKAPWEKVLFNAFFAHGHPELMQLFEKSSTYCNRLRDWAHGRIDLPNRHTCVATISPVPSRMTRISRNPEFLRAEMISTARGTLALFNHSQARIDQWIENGAI